MLTKDIVVVVVAGFVDSKGLPIDQVGIREAKFMSMEIVISILGPIQIIILYQSKYTHKLTHMARKVFANCLKI